MFNAGCLTYVQVHMCTSSDIYLLSLREENAAFDHFRSVNAIFDPL